MVAAAALATLALLIPAGASARSRDLWTTVNSCNSPHDPNTMGIRGRMPGNGARGRLYMRFAAQFRDTDGRWEYVGGSARSPWMYAGSALFTHQEMGYTFSFDPPQSGDHFVLRGVADFQWRARRRHHGRASMAIVRHERLVTEAGHPSDGADPDGYSAASCEIDGA